MRHGLSVAALLSLLTLVGCGGSMKTTRFANPNFDFSFVERVAVVPFDNQTNDRQAGLRATRLTITELLASGAVDVVEPGEVQAALSKITGAQINRGVSPSTEQVVSVGQALGVQALIMGTVTQSENLRSGSVPIPVVTLDVHLLETETGAPVWAATHTEKGAGFGAKLLGTGGEPISQTTRRCVRRIVKTLVR